MKIKFCGASTGVTGSCHLLTSGEHKILLDCGQFQGGKAQDALNYEKFPFEPSEIECVVLSHAHIDHCGRLPLLTKRGFEGKIYCTDATADLLSVMLKDSAYIHEKETEWKNRKAERAGREQVEPLYTIEDAEKALSLVSPILYDQQIEINSDMKIVFNDAGHILGSAITELWVTEDDKESKIVFSGDLGMEGRPILRDPTYIKKADYVIMETTYGNRIHKELGSGVDKLIEIILNTTRRGGNVVIPSFAVGRTQELIYELNRFYDSNNEYRKELDKIFVYIDSPMATTATEIFRRNAQVFDEETREYILKGDNPLEFKNLKFTRSSKESQDLNFNKEPKIIISASGMCEAGRIRHHLKHNLWNPKNSIVFVGYQGQGTLGRSLVEGIKMVTLFGEEIQVNAEIHNLEGFSGHADQNGLFAWLAHFEQKPKQIFLVHGEEESKKDFAKLVNEKLSYEPIVVMGNSEFELDMNKSEIVNMDSAREQAAEADKIQKVRDKLSSIHLDLEQILYSANLAVEENISDKKITLINNIIQELEKSTINLATAVNEDDGLREEK
ncbi:metallo-beta-lactamase [Eubacterium sulci ATCC 35585]|nr:metallo-beta-lactamase [Eubacterium sulci ATCC 35585]MBF1138743.1 MBL fold metallo-hydrolase [[Eubacterium] sulci]EUC77940.1 beta-Casp domain protein [Eubacterium sulci ATCC 35585]MBF1156377.1 MBL fold metallo-hydrolase [[Eubacterium] sulci]MBF1171152.1 MBL fold metallo-hydrolase [[Eubacterium] sulci]